MSYLRDLIIIVRTKRYTAASNKLSVGIGSVTIDTGCAGISAFITLIRASHTPTDPINTDGIISRRTVLIVTMCIILIEESIRRDSA